MSKKAVFFPNLDGLRFLAFLSVFFAHAFYAEATHIETNKIYLTTIFIGKYGILGVNFFFVLSGFLITYLLLEEKKLANGINVRNFYMRRVLRIWPLYFAIVIIGYFAFPLIQSFFGKNITESNLSYYIFFISNYLPHPPESAILGVLWSISVEEQFYLLWPILIIFTPNKYLSYLFFTIILLSFCARTFWVENVHIDSLSCFSDLTMGSLMAYYSTTGNKLKNYFSSLSKSIICTVYLIGFSAICLQVFWSDISFLYKNERFLFSLFFVFIILEQNYAKNSWYKMQNFTLISQLGKYTYGLYMLHFVAIYIVHKCFVLMDIELNLALVLIVIPLISLVFSIALAFISYRVLEKPFLDLKKKFS